MGLNVDLSYAFLPGQEARFSAYLDKAALARRLLMEGQGPGPDCRGWLSLPFTIPETDIARLEEAGRKIRSDSEVLVVIGIGGSYLGARAALSFLGASHPEFHRPGAPLVLFAGLSLCSDDLAELIDFIKDRSFSLAVVSKSGSTTEPAIAFRILKGVLEEKYGLREAARRVYVITDSKKGILKAIADYEGYDVYAIPDDIGGRYSVLTPVGLLPMAAAGVDIRAMLRGAKDALLSGKTLPPAENPSLRYAAYRQLMAGEGKRIEIFATFSPSHRHLGEWWKQLFGESEGKEHGGLFPAPVVFTTELHSIGQYIQEGSRTMFETFLLAASPRRQLSIPVEAANLDGLNFLAGKPLSFVNRQAFRATAAAHFDGGTPNLSIVFDRIDEYHFGYLVGFFEFSCAVSGFIQGVNPFDQPGVEAYKNNLFALIGKPGYEKRSRELFERLGREER